MEVATKMNVQYLWDCLLVEMEQEWQVEVCLMKQDLQDLYLVLAVQLNC